MRDIFNYKSVTFGLIINVTLRAKTLGSPQKTGLFSNVTPMSRYGHLGLKLGRVTWPCEADDHS